MVGLQLVAVDLGLEQERGEVVPRVREVLLDARVEVRVELARVDVRLAFLGRGVDVFDHHADEAAEDVGVGFSGKPSILAMTRSGMSCA